MAKDKKYTDIQMEYMVTNYAFWIQSACSSVGNPNFLKWGRQELEWMINLLLDSNQIDTIMKSLLEYEEPIGFRICSVTGERIEEGYCLFDGDAYYKNEADLIDELKNYERELGIEGKTVSDEELANLAYDKGMYYWTGWHEELE